MWNRFVALGLLFVLLGCAGKVTVVPLSSRDPADPEGPEGASPPVRSLMDPAEPPEWAASFLCPAHPDAPRHGPGRCSECGRALVERRSR